MTVLFASDGVLRYRYRKTNPEYPEKHALRLAMEKRLPMHYFHGILAGKFVAAWPVFVVRNKRVESSSLIAVDDASHSNLAMPEADQYPHVGEDIDAGRRQYGTAIVR